MSNEILEMCIFDGHELVTTLTEQAPEQDGVFNNVKLVYVTETKIDGHSLAKCTTTEKNAAIRHGRDEHQRYRSMAAALKLL